MSGGGNRRKGHRFERHVAKLFRRWFPDAKRGYQYRGSDKDCDVVGTPFYVECKYAKQRFQHSLYFTWVEAWKKRNQLLPPVHLHAGLILIVRRLAYKPIMVGMSFTAAGLLGIPSKDDIRESGRTSCTWDIFSKAMDKKYKVYDQSC